MLLDENDNGEITMDEFVSAVTSDPDVLRLLAQHPALQPLTNPDAYEASFRSIDRNRNGTITLGELAVFCNEELPSLHEAKTARYVVKRANGRPELHCSTRGEWQRARQVEHTLQQREEYEAEAALLVPEINEEEENEDGSASDCAPGEAGQAGEGRAGDDRHANSKNRKIRVWSAGGPDSDRVR